MTDKQFVRFGLVFIACTIVAIGFNGKATKPYNVDEARTRYYWKQDDVRTAGLFFMGKTTAERHKERNALLAVEGDPSLDGYSRGFLEWLVHDLECRPAEYHYDVKCIRLLGAAKNYLKSLDSVGKCGKLKVLPEQTTTTRDKSC